jgi:hypothetical protein
MPMATESWARLGQMVVAPLALTGESSHEFCGEVLGISGASAVSAPEDHVAAKDGPRHRLRCTREPPATTPATGLRLSAL